MKLLSLNFFHTCDESHSRYIRQCHHRFFMGVQCPVHVFMGVLMASGSRFAFHLSRHSLKLRRIVLTARLHDRLSLPLTLTPKSLALSIQMLVNSGCCCRFPSVFVSSLTFLSLLLLYFILSVYEHPPHSFLLLFHFILCVTLNWMLPPHSCSTSMHSMFYFIFPFSFLFVFGLDSWILVCSRRLMLVWVSLSSQIFTTVIVNATRNSSS